MFIVGEMKGLTIKLPLIVAVGIILILLTLFILQNRTHLISRVAMDTFETENVVLACGTVKGCDIPASVVES